MKMDDIFAGLEDFGLENLKDLKLNDKDEKKVEDSKAGEAAELNPLDFIFEKNVDCRVCGKPFKSYQTKTRIKLEGIDEDLMPTYSPVDPLLYDIMVCPHCGYAALRSTFNAINDRQGEYISETITPKYKHKEHPAIMDIDMAIAEYKLALLCCVVKKGRLNEKGYLCMKISWLYKRKGDEANELLFVKQANQSFTDAFAKETFPFCGLDESTVNYLMARFALKLKSYEESLRFISRLITFKNLNPRLKERAIDMKDELRLLMKK
jgi:uncharacterized protein (DUF2225 family)